jgi:hypothetical protein
MVCNKFEESGLLYVSGELSIAEARGYESHVASCEECRRETEAYLKERATFYTADILSERPSPAVDAEILRVGSNKSLTPTAFAPMFFLRKYAPIPVFLMLAMVAVGGYIKYHDIAATKLRTSYGGETAVASMPSENMDVPADMEGEELARSDSGKTDADTGVPFSKTMGNLKMEGVVTVKDEGKR